MYYKLTKLADEEYGYYERLASGWIVTRRFPVKLISTSLS